MRKSLFVASLLLSFMVLASGGDEKKSDKKKESAEEAIPSAKVENYIVGLVKAGPNQEVDSLRRAELLESHVAFLKKQNEAGKLFASGPLSSDPAVRGLYIFNVRTIEGAKTLMAQDESISSGWIELDYHVWNTRDYDAPVAKDIEAGEEEDGFASRRVINIILVTVFTAIILVLMFRTFRMKAEV